MYSDFEKKIFGALERAHQQKEAMSKEERAVINVLARLYGKAPVSQSYIARSEDWMGCHEKYEEKKTPNETTLRKVRQIIRDLRVNYGIPIISSRNGYKIAATEEEAREYVDRLGKEALAQSRAWFETYRAMNRVLGIESEYFERQKNLFENL